MAEKATVEVVVVVMDMVGDDDTAAGTKDNANGLRFVEVGWDWKVVRKDMVESEVLQIWGVREDDVVREGERIDLVDVTEGIAKGLRFGGLD